MTEAQRFHFNEATRAVASLRVAMKGLIQASEPVFDSDHTDGFVSGLLMGLELTLHSSAARWNQ